MQFFPRFTSLMSCFVNKQSCPSSTKLDTLARTLRKPSTSKTLCMGTVSVAPSGRNSSVTECDEYSLPAPAVLMVLTHDTMEPGTILETNSGVRGHRWQDAPESIMGSSLTSAVIALIINAHSGILQPISLRLSGEDGGA